MKQLFKSYETENIMYVLHFFIDINIIIIKSHL